MGTKEWLDGCTKEQKDSYLLLGFGFWPTIMMKYIGEAGVRLVCKSRYEFVKNMTR
jgi:hypothetical protein